MKLHQCQFIAVYDEIKLDMQLSFAQLGIPNKAKILMSGVRTNKKYTNFLIKYFNRFKNVKLNDDWNVGPNSWDALYIKAEKDFLFFGVGIFEIY